MRLRNVKGSRETIAANEFVVHDEEAAKGHWHEIFGNDRPIHIEIGMGKGQFIMELAAQNPDINYIGIEKFSSVLVRAIEKQELKQLPNLKFIRMDAEYIENVFQKGEVDYIYLNFSDPWPKDRHAKRRLTSHQFLNRYGNILSDAGGVTFKTDNTELFDFSLAELEVAKWELVNSTRDLHNSKYNEGNIMTEYEKRFSGMGNPICRMVCKPMK
ncbi:MAG: tRNA (guanosine(46)-N7)-methyltransferase TrmB [Clostridium sp.]|nr:tRNA (guanosine(46)-N7)-methyltransferase TrmB [Clostridium sp.]MCM1460093.1 tRNA (guanosine(46)-N7)-methyltransferase TrmB [Bacteroides sp.]